jgi:hypothetical protein
MDASDVHDDAVTHVGNPRLIHIVKEWQREIKNVWVRFHYPDYVAVNDATNAC